MTADKNSLLREMKRAANIAGNLVDALRAYRVPACIAALALMYGAARVNRLRGVSRETFISVCGLIFDLAADDEEVRAAQARRQSAAPAGSAPKSAASSTP